MLSGLKEPGPSKAKHREVPPSDHRANKEAGPSLPAGFQRAEWNCKYESRHTIFQNTITNEDGDILNIFPAGPFPSSMGS